MTVVDMAFVFFAGFVRHEFGPWEACGEGLFHELGRVSPMLLYSVRLNPDVAYAEP